MTCAELTEVELLVKHRSVACVAPLSAGTIPAFAYCWDADRVEIPELNPSAVELDQVGNAVGREDGIIEARRDQVMAGRAGTLVDQPGADQALVEIIVFGKPGADRGLLFAANPIIGASAPRQRGPRPSRSGQRRR